MFRRICDEYSKEKESSPFKDNPLAHLIRQELRAEFWAQEPGWIKYKWIGSPGKSKWVEAPWLGILEPLVTTSAELGYYPV